MRPRSSQRPWVLGPRTTQWRPTELVSTYQDLANLRVSSVVANNVGDVARAGVVSHDLSDALLQG